MIKTKDLLNGLLMSPWKNKFFFHISECVNLNHDYLPALRGGGDWMVSDAKYNNECEVLTFGRRASISGELPSNVFGWPASSDGRPEIVAGGGPAKYCWKSAGV